jgi:hypothetical protein
MNRMRTTAAIIGAVLFLAAAPAWAHHAFAAEFDSTKPITLRGTVTKVEWINPHSWIHVDVKSPDGTVVSWMVEGGSPNALVRRGVTKNLIPEGTEVVVDGYRAKDGTNRANGRNITLADGRKLAVGSTNSEEQPK